jgi:hypothetical protein
VVFEKVLQRLAERLPLQGFAILALIEFGGVLFIIVIFS